jgi:hypothetical protein
MRPATLARLYDRKKFGMVGVRTASLSQLHGKPGTGIAAQLVGGAVSKDPAPKRWQARPFVGDVGRPGLKLEPEFMKLRLAEDERWPGGCRNAQGAPTTAVRRFALLRGL